MPFLSIVFKAEADNRKGYPFIFTWNKNLFRIKFTLNLRLFFLFEKETWFPTIAFFPVISQTRDMTHFY